MSTWPKYGFKTNLGRRLEAVPEPEPPPTPDTFWVCKKRLHISTLPAIVCVRCRAQGAPLALLGMEKAQVVK